MKDDVKKTWVKDEVTRAWVEKKDEAEAPVLKKPFIGAGLNLLFPGAGYLYAGSGRFWTIVLIVVFAVLTYAIYVISPGLLVLNIWVRVFFAVHGGMKTIGNNRDIMDPNKYAVKDSRRRPGRRDDMYIGQF